MRTQLSTVAFAASALVVAVGCSNPAHSAPPEPAPVLPAAQPLTSPPPTAFPPDPPVCDAGDVLLFVSPQPPFQGSPLKIMAVFDHAIDAELALTGPKHSAVLATRDRQGGPPYFLFLQVDDPQPGKYEASLTRTGSCDAPPVTRSIRVASHTPRPPNPPDTKLWPTRGMWTHGMENLYSAWIQKLFDAPLDTQPSWPSLREVLTDAKRNLLFDHLGVGEDEQEEKVRPDCADLPYFLRAYFAFKLRLPFAWSTCTRGGGGAAPSCKDWTSSEDPPDDSVTKSLAALQDASVDEAAKESAAGPSEARERPPGKKVDPAMHGFAEFLHSTLADAAQSGAGRTLADDSTSDYYPVALTTETLRPGTIFADPYGHVLVIAKRIPQTPTSGGILLAVDGQPDGTVGRKRFWRGNFLFALSPALGSPGFKRFRPFARDPASGDLRPLENREIPDFSLDQYAGGVEGFYDKMDDVLSPVPLDPTRAVLETMQALEEQVRTRVLSVDNGRKFLESGRPPAEMPDGAKIFETNGDWEDFSTPSRDLRLLIAIDVLRAFPARVARRPERYAMPAGRSPAEIQGALDALITRELRARRFQYTRSDGSPWELTLDDVLRRGSDLEMAYNPNDCVEVRWGAPAGSQEASTCTRHAPPEQLAKMAEVRGWFHTRTRPPRE